ncbi:hypothetical protein TpMuguga_01g01111 [Theileria parva strain Muguga]|uniref:Uncharacterized protein n=1 Tax=Theileria parva TaxID=5875 RepID=Q4N6Q9_THEPA|nr:uncharacterized protein TpMuguga_01g01111 [Theileria parva strain Muguga]EAN34349.1 hypothetical protein TpMuguga_01g01111 [Theileria parva strain Muguga]|eukprot:XP_766632.1 hypothetical protein [Theileria parva strain Muguga]
MSNETPEESEVNLNHESSDCTNEELKDFQINHNFPETNTHSDEDKTHEHNRNINELYSSENKELEENKNLETDNSSSFHKIHNNEDKNLEEELDLQESQQTNACVDEVEEFQTPEITPKEIFTQSPDFSFGGSESLPDSNENEPEQKSDDATGKIVDETNKRETDPDESKSPEPKSEDDSNQFSEQLSEPASEPVTDQFSEHQSEQLQEDLSETVSELKTPELLSEPYEYSEYNKSNPPEEFEERDSYDQDTSEQLSEPVSEPVYEQLSEQLQEQLSGQISKQLSETVSEPVPEPEVPEPQLTRTESKSKHHKKFKSTSKTFESLFHKSSIGKSSKSSKSKSSTKSETSPSSKDVVVTSTSSYTSSSTKKKDKGPCWTYYEIPGKPGRKGPTLGVFCDSMKSSKSYQRTESSKDQKCIVLQTPDSLERYLHPFQVVSNYYLNPNYIKYYSNSVNMEDSVVNTYYYTNMMTQRKSLFPYSVTKTVSGNVPGMGRVLACGTQCGKIIIYSFFTLDELIVLDTRTVYDRYLSRENSLDSETDFDIDKAIDSTLFEVNSLAFITTFENYSTILAIGNHLGHLLLYQIPKMQLIKLIYPSNMTNANVYCSSYSSNTLTSSVSLTSSCTDESEPDSILIDDLELSKIRRHKVLNTNNHQDSQSQTDEVAFITCLGYCPTTGDLWVGYGNSSFAIYSSSFKLRKFYSSNNLLDTNNNIVIDDNVYGVNNFEYCTCEQIVLVVYGNVKVDIFTFSGNFLSTISATRLTNTTTPISSVHVSNNSNGSILYIGLMDGSLLVKQILYNTNSNNNISKENGNHNDGLDELLINTIEFILLYKFIYKFDGEINSGAPVSCICPVPSQQLVLLGDASGGLSVISNLSI